MKYEQVRPKWCKHHSCIFKRRAMDNICGGDLPEPQDHGKCKKVNTHRVCIRFEEEGVITDIQLNDTDLDWFRWIFDALDGEKTSWISTSDGTKKLEQDK